VEVALLRAEGRRGQLQGRRCAPCMRLALLRWVPLLAPHRSLRGLHAWHAVMYGKAQALRTKKCLFIDVDDTLYQNGWNTAELLTKSIATYCEDRLGISYEKSVELYKVHGTCLKGLEVEQIPHDRDHFLETVHDVHLEFGQDDKLRSVLERIDFDNVHARVFTASVESHAMRCLERLNVADVLVSQERPIIDVRAVGFVSKHSPEAFERALDAVQRTDPHVDPADCTLVDDSWTNIRAAKAKGWRTVVCGKVSRYGECASGLAEADFAIESIHDLPTVLPDFFLPPGASAPAGTADAVAVPAEATGMEGGSWEPRGARGPAAPSAQ